jgi:hypothetical protein
MGSGMTRSDDDDDTVDVQGSGPPTVRVVPRSDVKPAVAVPVAPAAWHVHLGVAAVVALLAAAGAGLGVWLALSPLVRPAAAPAPAPLAAVAPAPARSLLPPTPPPPLAAAAMPSAPAVLPSPPRFVVHIADEAQIAADRPDALTYFRFERNSRIIVLDFPTLIEQGLTLNRVATLVEKNGEPHDRVLDDAALDAAIQAKGDTVESYYYGHDYAAADLARFFALADRDRIALRPEEERLRAFLVQEGLLVPGAVGAVVSVPRAGELEIDPRMRAAILHDELAHGEYFTRPAYATYVRRFWSEGLDDAARQAFRRFLAAEDFDPTLDDLIANEMQGYLATSPDPRLFSARALGLPQSRLVPLQEAFVLGMPAGWLRDAAQAAAMLRP